MSSRAVEEALGRLRERASERDRGTGVALALRMTSSRAADIGIVSVARLPSIRSDTPAQDETGVFLYNPDYSDPSDPSPDIGAPDEDELFGMGGMGFAGGFALTTPGDGAFAEPTIAPEDQEAMDSVDDTDAENADDDEEIPP